MEESGSGNVPLTNRSYGPDPEHCHKLSIFFSIFRACPPTFLSLRGPFLVVGIPVFPSTNKKIT